MKWNDSNSEQSYFTQAASWADDIYTASISRANRYKIAFYISLAAICLLAFTIMLMMPLEKTDLVVVHQSDDGVVWVEPAKQPYAPENRAQTESELVNYVINRESYSSYSFHAQYSLVNITSSDAIAKEYDEEQSSHNPKSPINTFGKNAEKVVHVNNVVFMDNIKLNSDNGNKISHQNLAQVNFTVTIKNNSGVIESTTPLTALINWTYRGVPNNPDIRWQNWNGFTVTHYSLQQRSEE
jgi:type IV secretion system protein VirB8